MYFIKNLNNPLFKDDSKKKGYYTKIAEQIGRPWEFAKTKIDQGIEKIKGPSLSSEDLINIEAFNVLENENQIFLKDLTIAQRILEKQNINPSSNSFLKEAEKKEDQEDFGETAKFSFNYNKKKGFYANFEFDAQYDGSLKSKNTTRLYDYLDRMKNAEKLDWRRDKEKGTIIVKISVNDVFQESMKNFKDDKDYQKNILEESEKMSELLIGKTEAGTKFLTDLSKTLESFGKKDPKAIKDAQDFTKLSLLKISIEKGNLDLEMKNLLTEKLASQMKNQFGKVASELSDVSGADFKGAMNDKFKEFSKKHSDKFNDPFYTMAYSKISDQDVENFKADYLKGIDDKLSKNSFKNEIDQKDLDDLKGAIYQEKRDILEKKVNEIGEKMKEKDPDAIYKAQKYINETKRSNFERGR